MPVTKVMVPEVLGTGVTAKGVPMAAEVGPFGAVGLWRLHPPFAMQHVEHH